MEEPNYVLRTNESVLMPGEESKWESILRKAVLAIIAIIIVASIIFQENLFLELSIISRILLILLTIKVIFFGLKRVETPSPIELRFFDDRLQYYSPRRFFSKRNIRRQFKTLKYEDITKIVYKKSYHMIKIYGDGISVWYSYDKDDNLPDQPTEVRNAKDGMIYFSARQAPDADFVREFEDHTPLKVTVED